MNGSTRRRTIRCNIRIVVAACSSLFLVLQTGLASSSAGGVPSIRSSGPIARHAAPAIALPPADVRAIQDVEVAPPDGTVSRRQRKELSASISRSRGGNVMQRKPKAGGMLLVGTYFFLWYALNIMYNIANKKALNAISLPWLISATQMLVGAIFVLPMWLLRLRDTPGLSLKNVQALAPIATFHMLSHLSAVIGLGAGAVSFVHIVKAAEPLFTALFSAVFLKQMFSPLVYVTLIPVVAGVAIASLKELDFKWEALGGAMGSNVAASSRAILSKHRMDRDVGKNMTPANFYAVLTIMATVMLMPLSVVVEGGKAQGLWKTTVGITATREEIVYNTVLSGIFFYLYNEVAFRCLHVVHPVTHAVGNTFKRVFLIATSILVFGSKLTPMSTFGSFMAIAGVLLYSLVKEWTSSDKRVKAQGSR